MLDGGIITIGSNTQIGPNCQFLTPNHPIDYIERRKPIERCSPITIGEDCWFGGGVTVCPGVTIGDRCIIGAGSVVVKDIPSDSMAVGNPCRVVRKRFDDEFIAYLLNLKWWDWDIEKIEANFEALSSGDLSLIKIIEK